MTIEHAAPVECRAVGRTLSGVGMPYGTVAPGYREMFEPGGLVGLADPFPLVMQHDRDLVIASTADVLRVTDTPTAFEARAELPLDSAALTLVRSRALTGMSVGFVAHREHRDAAGLRVVSRYSYDHLGLVDRPGYPAAKVEVRARSGFSFRSAMPRDRRVRCECSGPGQKFARMAGRELSAAFDRAFARAAEELADEAGDVTAVLGNYSQPLASASRGTLRRTGDVEVEIDIPDSDAGRAALAAHDDAGVIVRPFLQPLADDVPRIDGDEAIWDGPFDVRSFVVSATDAREGWPPAQLGGVAERADRRLVLL